MRKASSLELRSTALRERNGVIQHDACSPVIERYYTVREVASILNLSDDKVRRMFQDEPGVLIIGDEKTRLKRKYLTLRIPESVLQRVLKRLSNV
jgi:hypothetical protein